MSANEVVQEKQSDQKFVFLNYDQDALDAAYNQAVYAPHSEHIRKRMAQQSEQIRSMLSLVERSAYGNTEIEHLDIYRTSKKDAPTVVFVHGGAWRRGLASQNAFAAQMFTDAGINFVVPDFSWVQDASDSLRTLADQVCRSLIWVWKNIRSINGDSEKIYLVGHSSGAHLAAVALTTEWNNQYDSSLPKNFIKGSVLCSGMYDLHPVRLSARSSYVKFDDDLVNKLSPQRHIDKILAPIVLVYGGLETPEFQRQSIDFSAALEKSSKPVKLILAENYNHFELKETLANPYGHFGRAVLEQISAR